MHGSTLWVLLLALVVCGCDRARPAAGSPALVTVNGKPLTRDEIKAKFEEQPLGVRGRYRSLERKKEFVDSLVRFEVLLQEARRRGLENDPEVRATLERVLVQRLLRAEQEALEKASPVPEVELRKYYDEHLAEFVRPAKVRASHVFLAVPKGDAKRPRVLEEARKLLADIKANEAGPNRAIFADLAAKRSDDLSTRPLAGDLGFKSGDELRAAWGQEFADAVSKLTQLGEVIGPIETEKGVHLVKFAGRQEGFEQSFESVRGRLSSRLSMERRAKGLEDFNARLKAEAKIVLDEKALDALDVTGAAK